MNKIYVCPDEKDFLTQEGLGSFEELWDRRDPWHDKVNRGRSRNGWSGVCRIEIGGRTFFLKKQENFFSYSAGFPFRRLLAEREFDNIQLFNSLRIPSVKAVYFGMLKRGNKHQALIMTEALEGYVPLHEVENKWRDEQQENHAKQRSLITSIASLIRQAHDHGVAHNSFRPKHIFVSKDYCSEADPSSEKLDCRFIDLEQAGKVPVGSKKQLRDLATLHRKSSPYWSEEVRLLFILSYLGKEEFDAEAEDFIAKVLAASKDNRSPTKRNLKRLAGHIFR